MIHTTVVEVVEQGITEIQIPGQPTAVTLISTGLVPVKGDTGATGNPGPQGPPGDINATAIGGFPVALSSSRSGDLLGIDNGNIVNVGELSLDAGYF